MPLATICRVCLAVGMRSFRIEGSLQLVYEKLTSTALHTAGRKPMSACYICYAQLKKCRKLMLTSSRAENILNHILHKHSKISLQSMSQFDRVAYGLCSSLTRANTEYYDSTSLPSAPIEVKMESALEESDFDRTEIENEQLDDSFHLPPLVPINGLQIDAEVDTISQVQDTKTDIKEESDVGDREGSLQPLDVTAVNIHDMKFEIDEDDLMTQLQETERDKNKVQAIRERQHPTQVQTSEADNQEQSKFIKTKTKKPSVGPFPCNHCHKIFKRLKNMNKHTQIHIYEEYYECDICQYRSKQKNALVQHLRIHTDEKPFKCDTCQRRFKQSAHLVKHLRTHSGEKPYECDICQRQFGRREKLVTHLCTHTGEKRHKCRICKLRFSNISDLKRHLRTHTGEKPYKCYDCEQQFAQKGSLKRHIRTHTGEKPYKCDICLLSFNRKSSLLRHHGRKHTGNKKRRRRRTKIVDFTTSAQNESFLSETFSSTSRRRGLIVMSRIKIVLWTSYKLCFSLRLRGNKSN